MEATKIEDAAKAKAEQESQAQTVESSGSEPTGTSRFYCSRLVWQPGRHPRLASRTQAHPFRPVVRPFSDLFLRQHTPKHTHTHTHNTNTNTNTNTHTHTHTPHNTTHMPPPPSQQRDTNDSRIHRRLHTARALHVRGKCNAARCVHVHRKRRGGRQATGGVLHNHGRRALCKRDARRPSRLLGSAQ